MARLLSTRRFRSLTWINATCFCRREGDRPPNISEYQGACPLQLRSIWKASGEGQYLPSGNLPVFHPAPPKIPQGCFKMFVFSDADLLKAVVAAHQRGVKVRVMLNAARRDGDDDNKEVRKALEHAGIDVKDSNPAFGITHEKSMVVDEEIAFVKSLNWATKNLTETRDYAISTTHPHGVKEIIACFDADWHRKEFKPGLSAHLIWCPANGRERIANFIDGVKHTLFVQNERYQDSVIIERLVRARERGVKST